MASYSSSAEPPVTRRVEALGGFLGCYCAGGAPRVWIFDRGFLREGSPQQAILYSEVAQVGYPRKGVQRPALELTLSSGGMVTLEILGRDGRSEDVFEFGRFLSRAARTFEELGP